MAAVKYEFSIGVLKAFYSIFCPDILLVYISRNAVSENKKKSAPKVSSKCPFKNLKAMNFFFQSQRHPRAFKFRTKYLLKSACIYYENIKIHLFAFITDGKHLKLAITFTDHTKTT